MKDLNRRFHIFSPLLNPIARVLEECQVSSKVSGSGIKGVRELLNLTSLENYVSKRNPPKPRLSSCYRGKASIPL